MYIIKRMINLLNFIYFLPQSYDNPKLVDFALTDGKVAKVCIFIHWPNQSRVTVNPGGWVPPCNPLVAAAIDNLVLVRFVSYY